MKNGGSRRVRTTAMLDVDFIDAYSVAVKRDPEAFNWLRSEHCDWYAIHRLEIDLFSYIRLLVFEFIHRDNMKNPLLWRSVETFKHPRFLNTRRCPRIFGHRTHDTYAGWSANPTHPGA